jgi:hypothetical protein
LAIINRLTIESGVTKQQQPTTQLEVKTLLNRIQRFVGFIYHSIRLRGSGGSQRIEVKIEPHQGIRGKCATCLEPCPGYDLLPERRWLFPPLWGIGVNGVNLMGSHLTIQHFEHLFHSRLLSAISFQSPNRRSYRLALVATTP